MRFYKQNADVAIILLFPRSNEQRVFSSIIEQFTCPIFSGFRDSEIQIIALSGSAFAVIPTSNLFSFDISLSRNPDISSPSASRQPRVSFFFVFRRLSIGLHFVYCVQMRFEHGSAERGSALAAMSASNNNRRLPTRIAFCLFLLLPANLIRRTFVSCSGW